LIRGLFVLNFGIGGIGEYMGEIQNRWKQQINQQQLQQSSMMISCPDFDLQHDSILLEQPAPQVSILF